MVKIKKRLKVCLLLFLILPLLSQDRGFTGSIFSLKYSRKIPLHQESLSLSSQYLAPISFIKNRRAFEKRPRIERGLLALLLGGIFSFFQGTAQAEPPQATVSASVSKSDIPNDLKGILDTPQYRHILGVDYLFTSPFIRIEYHKNKQNGNGMILLIKRGVQDGESDEVLGRLRFENGTIKIFDDSLSPKTIPLPLEDADTKNPFIQYLLNKKMIVAIPVWEGNPSEIAKSFFSIKPSMEQKERVLPFKSVRADHQVKWMEYALGQGNQTLAALGLANCVAVTVYDPVSHTGAIAHFDPNQKVSGLFKQMIGNFTAMDPAKMEIRLIGGWSGYSERIIYYLRKEIRSHGFQISSEDILGEGISRRIRLDTATGSILYVAPKETEGMKDQSISA